MKKREKIIGIVMLAVIAIWGIMSLPQSRKDKLQMVKPAGRLGRLPGPKAEQSLQELDLERLIGQREVMSESPETLVIRDPFKKIELEV